jgi:hypothetical protein
LAGIADELAPLDPALAAGFDLGRATTFFFAISLGFFATGLGRVVPADFLTDPCLVLADACGFAFGLVAVRLARRAADPFRADLARVARRAALRLAIA